MTQNDIDVFNEGGNVSQNVMHHAHRTSIAEERERGKTSGGARLSRAANLPLTLSLCAASVTVLSSSQITSRGQEMRFCACLPVAAAAAAAVLHSLFTVIPLGPEERKSGRQWRKRQERDPPINLGTL